MLGKTNPVKFPLCRTGVILIVVLFILTASGNGTTYHVDANHLNASDVNEGTADLPWMTIQYAADTILPGDTVLVHTGDYGPVIFRISGTSDQPVIFTGIDSEGAIVREGIEFDRSVSHISLSNLQIRDFPVWGVFLRGDNRLIVLKGLDISGGESGIHLTWGYSGEDPLDGPVSNIHIENTAIRNSLYTALDGTPGPCDSLIFRNLTIYHEDSNIEASWGSDGIAIERGNHILIEDCRIFDNPGDGIDLNSRDYNGHAEGIIVRRNWIARNRRTGIKLWGGGLADSNVLWGQGSTPLFIGTFPGTYLIVHNTIAYNMWDPDYGTRNYSFVAAYPDDASDISASIDLTLVNNIFAFNCRDLFGGPTGIYLGEGVNLAQEGHNLFWSRTDGEIQAECVAGDSWFTRDQILNGSWSDASGHGIGEVTADPLFLSPWPDCDLHLNDISPAIDNGLYLPESPFDIDGNPRDETTRTDIGAYAHHSSDTSSVCQTQLSNTAEESPPIRIYPNPSNHQMNITYDLPYQGSVRIVIYDIRGRIVTALFQSFNQPAGRDALMWNWTDNVHHTVTSGVYLLIFEYNNRRHTKKITLIR